MVLDQFKKRFLDYFNKNGFDHMRGMIDPFEYHSLYIIMARLFNVMDYEGDKAPKWTYISPICVFFNGTSATIILFISLSEYVRIFSVHAITECGTYLLVMISELLSLYASQTGKKHFHNLLHALQADFEYVCTTGKKYRQKFFENQLLTFKLCILAVIFMANMGGGMAVWACVALAHALYKEIDRPLPFPFWIFGYNLSASPVYEILFNVSLLFVFIHVYQYSFMMMTQVMWIRVISCKSDIIRWNLQDLLVDVPPVRSREEDAYYTALIRQRMRVITMMHHSMLTLTEDYAAIFKMSLLYEQVIASPTICMTAYCFAEKMEAGEVQLILLLLCCTIVGVIFVPCYLCTYLLEKTEAISEACWDIPFWNAGPVVRVYLVLMMQRSMRNLPLVTAGLPNISLENYSAIITRAYSCFNMLRQADFNIE